MVSEWPWPGNSVPIILLRLPKWIQTKLQITQKQAVANVVWASVTVCQHFDNNVPHTKKVCDQHPTSAVNVTLHAFVLSAAVDQYLLPAGRSAGNPPSTVAAVDRRGRQTERRTDIRPFYRPCCAYYAGSVNKLYEINNLSSSTHQRATSVD